MEKDVFDLINYTQTDLQAYDQQELTDMEEARMKQFVQNHTGNKGDKRHRKLKTTAVAAAAVAVLMVGSITGISAASTENATAYRIASFLGIEKNLAPYETVVNQSITKDGVTLELKSAIMNQDELWVTVVTKSQDMRSDNFTVPSGMVYINGQEINAGALGEYTVIDEHTGQSLIRFPLEKHFEGDLNIKLSLSTPLKDVERAPHWIFAFCASGDQLRADTRNVRINQSFALPNGSNLTLNNYWENDVSCTIGFHVDQALKGQDVKIVGANDTGNSVEFKLDGMFTTEGKFVLNAEHRNLVENAQSLTLVVIADGQQMGDAFVVTRS